VDDIADMLLMQIAIIATGEAEVADLALTEESKQESLLF
jgi:hypothetical protein